MGERHLLLFLCQKSMLKATLLARQHGHLPPRPWVLFGADCLATGVREGEMKCNDGVVEEESAAYNWQML